MSDRSVSVTVKAQVGGFVAGMQTARANAAAFNAELQKSAAKRQSLSQLGSVAGKVGLVAAAGLGAAVVASANFDKAMSNVKAATHETSGAMERLRAAALKAGADTAFSATEAAAGIESLAKAGVSTESILSGGLSGALDLAAAGEMGVAEAAEAAAGAMAQFKLEGDQVPHVADLLAAAAGKAQGEVSDMVMALKQAGTVSAQTGLSLEETTGTLAAMAEQSLLGSDAGTSFKTMLAALTPNSTKAARAMEDYNIHAFDAQGKFVGMTELAGQLRDGLGNLTDEQRAMTLETIFGSDAVRAAAIVYDNGAEGIQKWINNTNDAGYAAETAAIKLDNLAGDIEALKGSLETALIGAGDGSQGMARQVVRSMTTMVNAFNSLPPAAQNATTGLLGVTAVTGGSLWFGAKVVGGVVDARNAITELGVASPRTASALGKLGRAAGVAGAALAGLAVIDAISSGAKQGVPGVQELTQSLLDLNDAAGAELPDEFQTITVKRRFAPDRTQSLEHSIERLADANMAQKLQDNITDAIGGIGGGSELKGARSQIEGLDAALTNLVAGAGPEVAAKSFDALAEKAGLSGDQIDDLRGLLPGYKDAIAGAENATTLAAAATGTLTAQQEKNAVVSAEQAKALKEARETAREAAEGFVNLGESLDDGKVSLNGWIKELAKQADALHNFRVNAETAAKKGLDDGLIDSLNEAGPAGAMRMKQLANATDTEIERANKAWRRGQREIDRYVDAVGGVPPAAGTDINITGMDAAMASLGRLLAALRLVQDKTVNITVNQRYGDPAGAKGGQDGGKDGDPKTAWYSGGFTGYMGRRQVAGVVHGQEFVVNADATATNRPLLEAMNAGRGKMMSAGLTGGGSAAVDQARFVAVVERLEARLARLGDDVREGAQVGSFHGTEGRFRAQGRASYLQTGGI